jgi:hypothetical protein
MRYPWPDTSECHHEICPQPGGKRFPALWGVCCLATPAIFETGSGAPAALHRLRRPDFCTISAPFLHLEMQFRKLRSRRAPKGDAKSRHRLQPRSRGRQSALSKLAEPSGPAHIASVSGSLLSVKEPWGHSGRHSTQKFTLAKRNFGKGKVKFYGSPIHFVRLFESAWSPFADGI